VHAQVTMPTMRADSLDCSVRSCRLAYQGSFMSTVLLRFAETTVTHSNLVTVLHEKEKDSISSIDNHTAIGLGKEYRCTSPAREGPP
jgi:hypothetical protein